MHASACLDDGRHILRVCICVCVCAGELTHPKLSFSHEGIPAVSSGNTAGSARSTGTGSASLVSGSAILKGIHPNPHHEDGSSLVNGGDSVADGTATTGMGSSDGGVSSASSAGMSTSGTCSTAHDDVTVLAPSIPGEAILPPRDQVSM